MSKNIKDYLHFHLGCEYLAEWDGKIRKVTARSLDTILGSKVGAIRPILRHLSDMKAKEAIEIAAMIWHCIYRYESEIYLIKSDVDDSDTDKVGFVGRDCDGDRIGLTVEVDRGIEFSVNGTKLTVRQFDIIRVLLSKHFDLFGLIEAGLAIDKTKQIALKQIT